MSKVLRRPMFRKGGNVGTGIMTGIVDREEYADAGSAMAAGQRGMGANIDFGLTNSAAETNPIYQQRTIPSLKNLTAESIEALQEAAGSRGGFDPLTSFLLAYGPAAAMENRGGGTIANLIAAAKEPAAALIKGKEDEDKFQRGLRTQATGAAIAQRNQMIAAESDRMFRADLAKAQADLNRELTNNEIEALKLRAQQKVKDDIKLAERKSELDIKKGKELLKEQEKLERASPEEKVEIFSLEYAKDYGGNQIKGRNRAEYEFVKGPLIEQNFGANKNGGFIDVDTTNLEKTQKLMKKKIKAGGENKIFTNIQDGTSYLLTEQGFKPIDINDPSAITAPVEEIKTGEETKKSIKEKMESDPNSIFRKGGIFLTEEEKKARDRGAINQSLSGIGEI